MPLTPCSACRWAAPSKRIACKDCSVQSQSSWQIMIQTLAQAGNRACKSEHYLAVVGTQPRMGSSLASGMGARTHGLLQLFGRQR